MKAEKKTFYYKNNRLQQLRGFCYTAQFGSVSRAAAQMGLTQSSVSLQIKALEQDLGIALFFRKGPQITLTEEGQKFLDLARTRMEGIEDLFETFANPSATPKKDELKIAANSTSLNFILPTVTAEYFKIYPHTRFTLQFAEQDEALGLIETEKVDFAVLPRRQHKPIPQEYKYIPVFYYQSCLITRADHPLAGRHGLTVEEISRYDLTLPARDWRVIPNLYDIFPEHGFNKELRVNFVNAETGRAYIEAGLAITISSNVWIKKNDPFLHATPLPHLFPNVDYGIVLKRTRTLPDKIKKFIEVAQSYAP